MDKDISINVEHILETLDKKFFDIPFENSTFQNENFIINAQQTPARAFRAIGLRMYSKISAVNELKYARQLETVDIDEWQEVIDAENSTQFEKRRAAINIKQKQSMSGYTDKLLNDAIAELNFLYRKLKEFPEYTREQFEGEERDHFTYKLNLSLQTNGNGAQESLTYMQNTEAFNINMEQAKKLILKKD